MSLFLPLLGPARVAGAAIQISAIQVLPEAPQAGRPMSIRIQVTDFDEIAGGTVTLKSPSGAQVLILPVVKQATILEAAHTLDPGVEPGEWKIAKLVLRTTELRTATIEAGPGFEHKFKVTGTKADAFPPKLTRLYWQDETVAAGAPAVLVAEVSDMLPGRVSEVTVTLAPAQDEGDRLWQNDLRLVDQGNGKWKGTFLAPVMSIPLGKVEVLEANLADRAGNRVTLKDSDLKAIKPPILYIGASEAPAGLWTEPYIVNVLRPGAFSFLDWNAKDIESLGELFDQISNAPDVVRATLNWQLISLTEAVKELRKEIYQDPATKFRFVPLNTSGKWLALDRAFQGRLLLIRELERRAERNKAPLLQKKELQYVAQIVIGPSGPLTPIDPEAYAEGGPGLMAGVIDAVHRSSLPQGLMAAEHLANSYDSTSLLDRDLIWFFPFQHPSALAEHYVNGREIVLYLNQTETPQQLVHSFFHELGHHFSESFLTGTNIIISGQQKSFFEEYLALRGRAGFKGSSGWAGSLEENLAEDFAYAFLPDDLRPQYVQRGDFPPLSMYPAQLPEFRKWVEKGMKNELDPAVRFAHEGHVVVGLPELTGTFAPGKEVEWEVVPYLNGNPKEAPQRAKTEGDTGRFNIPVPVDSDPVQIVISRFEVKPRQGRLVCKEIPWWGQICSSDPTGTPAVAHVRYTTVLKAPFTPSLITSRATNRSDVTILQGDIHGTLSTEGRDGASVQLKPGENLFEVKVTPDAGAAADGAPYVMKVPVYYEPADSVTLEATAPGNVAEAEVSIKGTTAPWALVRAGGSVTPADRFGKFTMKVKGLSKGENTLKVEATSPGGTVKQQTLSVSYLSAADVDVQAPALTNGSATSIVVRTPGAERVTIAGRPATAEAGNSFRATVSLVTGENQVEVIAVNSAGQSTTTVKTIVRQGAGSLPIAVDNPVDWSASVERGSRVTLNGEGVAVNADGTYQVKLLPEQPGLQRFRLEIASPSGTLSYHEVQVVRPVVVEVPTLTNRAHVTLEGAVQPGARLVINEKPVGVGSNGRFEVAVSLTPGETLLSLRVEHSDLPGSVWSKTYPVSRVAVQVQETSEHLLILLPTVAPGTVFRVRDSKLSVTETTSGAVFRLVKPAPVLLRIDYTRTGGAPALLLLSTVSEVTTVALKPGSSTALVNGETQLMPVAPQVIDELVYIPLWFLVEALGGSLDLDPETEGLRARVNGHTIVVNRGSATAIVDGEIKSMPAPATSVENRTMVPLRFMAESLGATLTVGVDGSVEISLPVQ